MELTFRIFNYVKPKGLNFTLSEKLSWYSLSLMLIIGLGIHFFQKYSKFESNGFVYFVFIILSLCYFISFFVRLPEHENLNGFFEGKIIFENDGIIINDKKHFHHLILDLKIGYYDYYGTKTNNYRYGPVYTNGVSNKISFFYENEFLEHQFEINDSSLIDKFDFYLIDIICIEKIPYQRTYLNIIPEELRDLAVCERFIIDLIKNKRIDQTEGLLLICYNSNEEFKKIKEKYNLI